MLDICFGSLLVDFGLCESISNLYIGVIFIPLGVDFGPRGVDFFASGG